MVGKRILILGSGDIGMIMARRLTLEGAKVIAVAEIMDYPAGLTRNRVQCLDDFEIPLLLSHTVTRIDGHKRLTGCRIAKVDENLKPILSTETLFECDTLLLSVGLIPENELSTRAGVKLNAATGGPEVNQFMQTSVSCLFACGNVVHVNDLADNVSLESEAAGREAARYALGEFPEFSGSIACLPGKNIRYICPQAVALTGGNTETRLYFRIKQPQKNVRINVSCNGKTIFSKKVVKVNPGEMEFVTIKSSTLSAGEITIDVE